jgi:hypothetical protein
MNRFPQYFALFLIVFFVVGGYFIFGHRIKERKEDQVASVIFGDVAWDVGEIEQGINNIDEGIVAGDASSANLQRQNKGLDDWLFYFNNHYGFSFRYPLDFRISEFEDNGNFVALAEGAGEKRSFQIFVIPWDESASIITKERIKQDLPNMKISEPKTAVLSNNIRAFIFLSEASGVGDTREVWIVNNGFLYQITASIKIDAELSRIVGSMIFGN